MFRFVKILASLAFFASLSFAGPVSVYGALKACVISGKGQLCGSKAGWTNTAIQVRGVSLGWSVTNWESAAFFNERTVNAMVDGWKAEVIRVPLGYSEAGGYQTDASNWTRAKAAIDAAIAKDVYVIIDRHSYKAHQETNAVKTFFETTVAAYHNVPNVIFEIYNEPTDANGGTWANIKSHAETVISAIRAKGATNLILVGTPQWSARPSAANGNYLSDNNVAYVFHFYAASHQTNTGNYDSWPTYGSGITTVLNAGKPVFVTEYGTTHSDGGQNNTGNYNTHSASHSNTWHDFMDTHKISSCAWNVNDKYEGSAFFGTNSATTSSGNRFNQNNTANYTNKSLMTSSGAYIYDKLNAYAVSAPWGSTPTSSSSSGTSVSTLIADFEGWGTDPAEPRYNYSKLGTPFYVYKVDNGVIANPYVTGSTTDYDAITSSGDSHGRVAWLKDGFNVVTKVTTTPQSNGAVAIGVNIDLGSLTGCTAFQYDYKGPAHLFFPNQRTHDGDSTTAGVKGDWNQPHGDSYLTAASASWKTVTIKVPEDLVPSWGTASTWVGSKDIHKLTWEVKATSSTSSANSTQSLMIDNVTCIGANLSLPTPPKPSSSSAAATTSSSSAATTTSSSSAATTTSSSSTVVVTPSSSSAAPVPSGEKGYYISQFDGEETIYGDYPFAYTYNGVTIGNPRDTDGYIVTDQGVGKLRNAVLVDANDYGAGAIGIKNGTGTRKMADCSNGFSYWYKGVAHQFKIEINPASCATTATDGSNSFYKDVAASTSSWTKQTITLPLTTSAWTGSHCAAKTFNLSDATQMAWELKTGVSGNAGASVSLMIDNVVCLQGSGSDVMNNTAPANTITITTGWSSSSSSGGVVTPSSSSGGIVAQPSSSSSGGEAVTPSSSSGGIVAQPSSSSAGTTPIALSKIPFANGAQVISNGVFLQVVSDATLEVFGLSGNSVRKLNFSGGIYSVQLADLPKGLYIVKVSFGSRREVLRLPVN